ncbi:hypothetical protein FNU76_00115 [Chitinimonas arctica]|uniref:Translocator protein BipB-like C-terminal domain-containing protein n=1 Tax=Chitinimonas arctica TaxID=2594795 RepID=A0A516S9N9_9NEIS|nr:type III secretion system translocon subunit SctE [Chitinimonas arctica]QDQ24872.1 hypothetical protein FNU76_00115 [Chitinimonas arctica]
MTLAINTAIPQFTASPDVPEHVKQATTLAVLLPAKQLDGVSVDPDKKRDEKRGALDDFSLTVPNVVLSGVVQVLGALENILKRISPEEIPPETLKKVADKIADITGLDKEALGSLLTAVQTLLGRFAGAVTDLRCLTIKYMTEGQDKARKMQLEKELQKIKDQQDDARKAQKMGKLMDIFSWAISAAELVAGVVKVATGNPTGLADIAAGLTGLAKCFLTELTRAFPALKDKLAKVIEVLGYVQMGCEMVSGIANLMQLVRGFTAVKVIATQTTKEVTETSAVKLTELAQATAKIAEQSGKGTLAETLAIVAAKNLANDLAASVAPKIAGEVVQEVGSNLSKITFTLGSSTANTGKGLVQTAAAEAKKIMTQMVGKSLLETFNKAGIEKIVQASVEQATNSVIDKVARQGFGMVGKGGQALTGEALTQAKELLAKKVAEEIEKQLKKVITNNIKKAVKDATVLSFEAVRSAATYGKDVSGGVIKVLQAEVLAEIEKAAALVNFFSQMVEDIQSAKEKAHEALSNFCKDIGSGLESIGKTANETAQTFMAVASGIRP